MNDERALSMWCPELLSLLSETIVTPADVRRVNELNAIYQWETTLQKRIEGKQSEDD